jgi:hypothetical protein
MWKDLESLGLVRRARQADRTTSGRGWPTDRTQERSGTGIVRRGVTSIDSRTCGAIGCNHRFQVIGWCTCDSGPDFVSEQHPGAAVRTLQLRLVTADESHEPPLDLAEAAHAEGGFGYIPFSRDKARRVLVRALAEERRHLIAVADLRGRPEWFVLRLARKPSRRSGRPARGASRLAVLGWKWWVVTHPTLAGWIFRGGRRLLAVLALKLSENVFIGRADLSGLKRASRRPCAVHMVSITLQEIRYVQFFPRRKV